MFDGYSPQRQLVGQLEGRQSMRVNWQVLAKDICFYLIVVYFSKSGLVVMVRQTEHCVFGLSQRRTGVLCRHGHFTNEQELVFLSSS